MKNTALLSAFMLMLVGCATTPPPKADYTKFKLYQPKSILVLPPLNESAEVKAPGSFMSTITAPLAEKGYYVFPVALVESLMSENGLPTPGDMHRVPLDKLKEIFGADAVLYATIKEWKTQYAVIASSTTVRIHYRLVDLETGTELWNQEAFIVYDPNQSNPQGGLAGMIVGALVHKIASGVSDRETPVARNVNRFIVFNPNIGLLDGHRKAHKLTQDGEGTKTILKKKGLR